MGTRTRTVNNGLDNKGDALRGFMQACQSPSFADGTGSTRSFRSRI